jgi:hypothetical protein
MSVESVLAACDHLGDKQSEQIKLRAVYGQEGSPNAQWSKWTPNGFLELSITNPGAWGKVLPGQFFFVDLTLTDRDAT